MCFAGGLYEIEFQLKNGKEFKAYYTIATYDKLESAFKSDSEFKKFIFNVYGVHHLDSLRIYKDFHYINFPVYEHRSEKLIAILNEDLMTISKSDIKAMKFKSFKEIDHVGLYTQLDFQEILLFQNEPNYMDSYSIDAFQEVHTDISLLSYNQEINEKELNQLVRKFKEEYGARTEKDEHMKNSWIYREMINEWQKKLKTRNVHLIEVTYP